MEQDVIQLLPDAIANQIAAGEVIQRPASVVKELLENAIDAGGQNLQLILKDGGKTLIQIIDDGCGMSETDARMSLERHATSKLRTADDLFRLRTMGFRGEALPSIASVAHLEIRTRRHNDELGTLIQVEGSTLKKQEACQCPPGTSMSVKHLFFNVPARRNFLKSDSVEYKHIREEFVRITLAHPEISFSLYNNDQLELQLPATKLRRRVLALFPKRLESMLVPIEEETDILSIRGFVGKPSAAKKSRGEQYFFVNDRFIRSSYLNHAVVSAYDELLAEKAYPFYIIFLEVEPDRIDINVHPTKQEIKFEDERLIYNFLKATIRYGLGRASITPTLDFESDNVFHPSKIGSLRSEGSQLEPSQPLPSKINAGAAATPTENPQQVSTPPAHPFSGSDSRQDDARGSKPPREVSTGGSTPTTPRTGSSEGIRQANNLRNWERLYDVLGQEAETPAADSSFSFGDEEESEILPSRFSSDEPEDGPKRKAGEKPPYQLHLRYIVSPLKSGLLLIDQQAAHERILYEQFLRQLREQNSPSQQSLFPQTLELSVAEAGLLTEILPDLKELGFDLEPFGGQSFIIRGVPAELAGKTNELELVQQLLARYAENLDPELDAHEKVARSLARSAATRPGQELSQAEMYSLISQLFACEQHQFNPGGKRRCFITFELDELERRFQL
ncbi:MAG: DNA mismatch repair endonuclease MutL [Bacteroidota bacterium]